MVMLNGVGAEVDKTGRTVIQQRRAEASTAQPEVVPVDTRMNYGEHKGKMYSEIAVADPGYGDRMEASAPQGRRRPQYVLDYLAWWRSPQRQGPGATRTPAARTRQGMPEVRPERCYEANGGCQSFTRKGTNAYYSVVTCLECGHGERTKIAEVATHTRSRRAPRSCGSQRKHENDVYDLLQAVLQLHRHAQQG